MTKQRPPLSIDGALARIAGELPGGWKDMADLVGRSESTVRRWGDHDAPEQIPVPCAIAFDIAYLQAGGEGRPLFETYALQVDVALEQAFADEIELLRRVRALIKEGAEAQEWLIVASLPSASPADRTRAIKELEDLARVITGTIALLKNTQEPAKPPGSLGGSG